MHISKMLESIVGRGAPTVVNDVLRWTRRMFDYAIKRHIIQFNPASAFDLSDAGGQEKARERALSRDDHLNWLIFRKIQTNQQTNY